MTSYWRRSRQGDEAMNDELCTFCMIHNGRLDCSPTDATSSHGTISPQVQLCMMAERTKIDLCVDCAKARISAKSRCSTNVISHLYMTDQCPPRNLRINMKSMKCHGTGWGKKDIGLKINCASFAGIGLTTPSMNRNSNSLLSVRYTSVIHLNKL